MKWELFDWRALIRSYINSKRLNSYNSTSQIYTKIHIYTAEPMRVQFTSHMSLSVLRDQYTAIPLVGVLIICTYNIINYID